MDEQTRREASRLITRTYCRLILTLDANKTSYERVRDEIAALNDEWTDVFAGARAAAAARVARRWSRR